MSAYAILQSFKVLPILLPHQKEFYRVIPFGRILKMY